MQALDKSPIGLVQYQEVPTVEEFASVFLTKYVQAYNKLSEIDKKQQVLTNFVVPMLGKLRLDQIEAPHLTTFRARLTTSNSMRGGKLSSKTINNRMAIVMKMLRFAKDEGLISTVPEIDPLDVKKADFRFLKASEAIALIEEAHDTDNVWYAMVVCGLHTGMRNGELRALKWANVDFDLKIIHVRDSFYQMHEDGLKTEASRRDIPMTVTLSKVLKGLKRLGPYVFCRAPDGEPFSYWATHDALQQMAKHRGIKGMGWHTLRHTFASHLVMRGVPLRVVQALMGHTSITMTERYSHLVPESQESAVQVLMDVYKSINF